MLFQDILFVAAKQNGSAAAAPPLDLTVYYAAMLVQPDEFRMAAMQALADNLNVEPGLVAAIRALYLTAAHDLQATRINMMHPSELATIVNGAGTGVTYTADTSLKGDAVGAYVDSGIADNNAAPWGQDSAFLYAYVIAEPSAGSAIVGISNALTSRITGATGSAMGGRIHGTGTAPSTTPNSIGSVLVNRTGASTVEIYRYGVLEGTNAAAPSSAPGSGTICLFRNNSTFGDAAVAAWAFGAKLTASQKAAFDAAVAQYLGDIGAA